MRWHGVQTAARPHKFEQRKTSGRDFRGGAVEIIGRLRNRLQLCLQRVLTLNPLTSKLKSFVKRKLRNKT